MTWWRQHECQFTVMPAAFPICGISHAGLIHSFSLVILASYVSSHQLVRKIPVQQFLDGEQDDGALFFFPETSDFPLGVLAVIE